MLRVLLKRIVLLIRLLRRVRLLRPVHVFPQVVVSVPSPVAEATGIDRARQPKRKPSVTWNQQGVVFVQPQVRLTRALVACEAGPNRYQPYGGRTS